MVSVSCPAGGLVVGEDVGVEDIAGVVQGVWSEAVTRGLVVFVLFALGTNLNPDQTCASEDADVMMDCRF